MNSKRLSWTSFSLAAALLAGCAQHSSSPQKPSSAAEASPPSGAIDSPPVVVKEVPEPVSDPKAGQTTGEVSTPPPALTTGPKTEPLPDASKTRKDAPAMPKTYNAPPPMTIDANKTYTATIETSAGTITANLYPKDAPGHVNSFVFLSREGFYEGAIFHRVIPGFMIQGGDPTGTGTGGPGYKLKAEFNARKHKRGVLSAARTADPDSAGSQFFLMHADSPHLDNQYTAFGEVTDGMDVVDKIASAPRDRNDRPNNPTKIIKITIDEK
jgi:peptidyl-prolyl cis-trans isomerase B (cyclophilin B)